MPLASTAVLLAGGWKLVPLFWFFEWWWAPNEHRWAWIVAAQAGVVGAAWGFDGATALTLFPNDRLIIGALWIGSAGMLALSAAHSRRRGRSGF